jgi:NAD(P)-dependent dehydrogenase (short-subunit alcohol dehydrogenase family)
VARRLPRSLHLRARSCAGDAAARSRHNHFHRCISILRGKATFAAFAAAKAGLRVVSQSFAREFGPSGIHVVHVIVDGSIDGDKIFSVVSDMAQRKGPDGLIRPEATADAYWYLHTQHRSAWSQEIDLRPYSESF